MSLKALNVRGRRIMGVNGHTEILVKWHIPFGPHTRYLWEYCYSFDESTLYHLIQNNNNKEFIEKTKCSSYGCHDAFFLTSEEDKGWAKPDPVSNKYRKIIQKLPVAPTVDTEPRREPEAFLAYTELPEPHVFVKWRHTGIGHSTWVPMKSLSKITVLNSFKELAHIAKLWEVHTHKKATWIKELQRIWNLPQKARPPSKYLSKLIATTSADPSTPSVASSGSSSHVRSSRMADETRPMKRMRFCIHEDQMVDELKAYMLNRKQAIRQADESAKEALASSPQPNPQIASNSPMVMGPLASSPQPNPQIASNSPMVMGPLASTNSPVITNPTITASPPMPGMPPMSTNPLATTIASPNLPSPPPPPSVPSSLPIAAHPLSTTKRQTTANIPAQLSPPMTMIPPIPANLSMTRIPPISTNPPSSSNSVNEPLQRKTIDTSKLEVGPPSPWQHLTMARPRSPVKLPSPMPVSESSVNPAKRMPAASPQGSKRAEKQSRGHKEVASKAKELAAKGPRKSESSVSSQRLNLKGFNPYSKEMFNYCKWIVSKFLDASKLSRVCLCRSRCGQLHAEIQKCLRATKRGAALMEADEMTCIRCGTVAHAQCHLKCLEWQYIAHVQKDGCLGGSLQQYFSDNAVKCWTENFTCWICKLAYVDPFAPVERMFGYTWIGAEHQQEFVDPIPQYQSTAGGRYSVNLRVCVESTEAFRALERGWKLQLRCIKLRLDKGLGSTDNVYASPFTTYPKLPNGDCEIHFSYGTIEQIEKLRRPPFMRQRHDKFYDAPDPLLRYVAQSPDHPAMKAPTIKVYGDYDGIADGPYLIVLAIVKTQQTANYWIQQLTNNVELPLVVAEEFVRKAFFSTAPDPIETFSGGDPDDTQAEDDLDIVEFATRVKLTCPSTMLRIDVPARGIHCAHVQCFDLDYYIHSQNSIHQSQRWKCPICGLSARPHQIVIDSWCKSILRKTDEEDKLIDVYLEENALRWRVIGREIKGKNKNSLPEPSRPETIVKATTTVEAFVIDDDDDD